MGNKRMPRIQYLFHALTMIQNFKISGAYTKKAYGLITAFPVEQEKAGEIIHECESHYNKFHYLRRRKQTSKKLQNNNLQNYILYAS